jgi:hypothetical protein
MDGMGVGSRRHSRSKGILGGQSLDPLTVLEIFAAEAGATRVERGCDD